MKYALQILMIMAFAATSHAEDLRSYTKSKDSEIMSNAGLHMHASSANGQYLMTSDSRFIIKGDFKIIDRFNGRQVSSMSELRASKQFIDLNLIGIDPMELASASMGDRNAKHGALLFFNPLSDAMRPLLKKIERIHSKGQFVHLVPFPTKENSMEQVNDVICAFQSNSEATLQALLAGKTDFEHCAVQDKLMRSLLTASLLAQGEMPMAITSSGRLLLGKAATQFDEIVARDKQ